MYLFCPKKVITNWHWGMFPYPEHGCRQAPMRSPCMYIHIIYIPGIYIYILCAAHKVWTTFRPIRPPSWRRSGLQYTISKRLQYYTSIILIVFQVPDQSGTGIRRKRKRMKTARSIFYISIIFACLGNIGQIICRYSIGPPIRKCPIRT